MKRRSHPGPSFFACSLHPLVSPQATPGRPRRDSPESAKREVFIDDVDSFALSRDDGGKPTRCIDTNWKREFVAQTVEEPLDHRDVSRDHSGAQRIDGVLSDDTRRQREGNAR